MSHRVVDDHPLGTLFCLPFAGGSAYSYRDLERHAEGVRFVTLELPGRGRRFSAPLLTTLPDMVDELFGQIRGHLGGPYGLYGHSLGACLAYLLVKRITGERCPLPQRLFVSGREAPSISPQAEGRHLLPRDRFIEALRCFEGTVPEVLENREMMDLFEPVLRADFQALDGYVHERSAPFTVPITVLRGSEEKVSRDEALAWQKETTVAIEYREFTGGHFFIFRHAEAISRLLAQGLAGRSDRAA